MSRTGDIPLPRNARVLAVKLSSLGDLFHVLPVVHALRVQLDARIDWVTQPDYADLVRCFPDVERVITFPRRGPWRSLVAYAQEVRRERYDAVLDLQGLLKSAFAARLARTPLRIGPSWQREGARFLYHRVAGRRDKQRHAVEEAREFIRALGLNDEAPPAFPVRFPDVPVAGQTPRIALITGSRWPSKNWPPEHFIRLGQLLLTARAASFHLLGGASDFEMCERIRRGVGEDHAINYCGRTSLVELGGVLGQMDLVITVDSGPMHMAAALGRPVVALFGPTDPRRTGPYGGHSLVLQLNVPGCIPCFSRACSRGDQACLAGLSPEYAAERILNWPEGGYFEAAATSRTESITAR